MLSNMCTQNRILAHGVYLRSLKMHVFNAENVQISFTLCLVASGRVSISVLDKTHGVVLLSRGNEEPDSSLLIQHNLWWGAIFISVSGILKRKRQKCVFLEALLHQMLCDMLSQHLLVSGMLTFHNLQWTGNHQESFCLLLDVEHTLLIIKWQHHKDMC